MTMMTTVKQATTTVFWMMMEMMIIMMRTEGLTRALMKNDGVKNGKRRKEKTVFETIYRTEIKIILH